MVIPIKTAGSVDSLSVCKASKMHAKFLQNQSLITIIPGDQSLITVVHSDQSLFTIVLDDQSLIITVSSGQRLEICYNQFSILVKLS